jgi:hypothetical protein
MLTCAVVQLARSAIGFCASYSRETNSYGRGVYFADKAAYPVQGYHHHTSDGQCQLILADVLVGELSTVSEGFCWQGATLCYRCTLP